MTDTTRRRLRWILLALALAAAAGLLSALPITDWIESLRTTFDDLGLVGILLYPLAFGLLAAMLVPAAPLQLGAGLLFGLGVGLPVGLAGSWLSILFAFVIGRTIAHDAVQEAIAERPKVRAIEDVISDGGWKVVVLLRLSPLLPFSLHNYVYGITRIPFVQYYPAACAAVAPGTVMWVYLGYLGAAASESLGDGDASIWKWVLRGVGLVATIIVTVILARRAKTRLDDADDTDDAREPEAPSTAQLWALGVTAAVLIAAAILGRIYADTLADWLT